MVRLIGVVLVLSMGCVTTQMFAQVPTEPVPPGQSAAAAMAKAGDSPMAPAASRDYPLDSFTDFSALMVGSIMEMGEGKAEGHIYRSGRLMRMEGVEGRGYMITDLTSLETFGVSAGPCMHDTHPFFRASPFAAARPGYTVERVSAGTETQDGHSCKVEDITVSSPESGNPLKMRLWLAEDLQGFPIRIDFERAGGQHSTVRYKNVVLGPQDPTLFIHPKSCESLPQSSTPTKTKHRSSAHKKKPAVPSASSSGANSQK